MKRDTLEILPRKLYWELVENTIELNGGMSEIIIIHNRIESLKNIINRYYSCSEIVPIEIIIEREYLKSRLKSYCEVKNIINFCKICKN